MQNSVHTVLTCIAVSDMGTMTSYLVSCAYSPFSNCRFQIYMTRFEFLVNHLGYPYGWALFLKVNCLFFYVHTALDPRGPVHSSARDYSLPRRPHGLH